ncbi:hypothetical protein [Aureibacillus halotolerans]|uniref:hypothetical protein n=1 Tax=Aureibacillus halotolerans TaxID=1508390 RepID=UPI0010618E58|nr:hypothetical protein [Aureibacillus halotolerans]
MSSLRDSLEEDSYHLQRRVKREEENNVTQELKDKHKENLWHVKNTEEWFNLKLWLGDVFIEMKRYQEA